MTWNRQTALRWHQVPPYGQLSVPRGSRFSVGDLLHEVGEYYDCGALVRPGDVVFDVGANVGAFAISAAYKTGGDLSVYCFEPVPPIFSALAANAERNGFLGDAKTELFNLALCETGAEGEIELSYFTNLPTDSTCDLEGKRRDFDMYFEAQGKRAGEMVPGLLGRRAASAVRYFVANMHRFRATEWLFARVIGHRKMRCETTSLSNVIRGREVDRIDLLKVDVEGAELGVLRGIEAEHWALIRQVVLEGHDRDGRLDTIVGLLSEHGFDVAPTVRPRGAEERGLDNFLLYARRAEAARASAVA